MPPPPRLDALFSLRGVVAAALAYGAVNGALSLAARPALALDDVKLNVLTQSWQGGYLADNPPLFEWTLIVAQQAFGPTLSSFVFVKTVFLVVTAAFTFLAAKAAGAGQRSAAAAALALPLIPQFGWSFHQTLTHSTALFAAIAFFWFALLRLQDRARLADYALLGLALGAGVLSKYSFLGAAAAGFAAALLHAPLRSAVLSPKMIAAIAVAAAMTAPHLLWLSSSNAGAAAYVGERLAADGSHAKRAGEGFIAVLWALTSFLAPAAIAAALLLKRKTVSGLSGARSVLSDATILSAAGLLLAVVALGLSNFQERYAIPFLFPGYLWLIVTLGRTAAGPKTVQSLAAVSLVVAALFAGARSAELARPGPPFCDECRQHVPYAYLQAALQRKDLQDATLVGFDDHTAGNLRRMFPRARVLSSHLQFYAPPGGETGGCVFIWSADLSPPPAQSAIDQLESRLFERAGGPWRRRMNGEDGLRRTHWTIAPVDLATPIGAALCRP